MDDNEKNPSEEKKPSSADKKIHLDLSEALTKDFDDDDEIIELKDEVTPAGEEKESQIELHDPLTAQAPGEGPAEEKVIDLNAFNLETAEPQNADPVAANLAFEEEDEDDIARPTLAEDQPLKAEGDNDVMEITEFDDLVSEDDNGMITLTEEDAELEPEEEFLELIDIEQDSLAEMDADTEGEEIEDEIIQFDDPQADIEDMELEDFINDTLNEEIRIDDDIEEDVTDSLGIEAEPEINLKDRESGAEEFDFEMDSGEISEKINQLDTIFFNDAETEAESDDENTPDAEDREAVEAEAGLGHTESTAENENSGLTGVDPSREPLPDAGRGAMDADHDQIEKSIERIIQQNFSGKIESMLTEIIEKTVVKEIERLKNILLQDTNDDGS